MPTDSQYTALNPIKIGALDALHIDSNRYQAVVLLQGAQLIYFSNTVDNAENKDFENLALHYHTDNWLWLSPLAEYNQQDSVRGGVPICWPIFGQFTANPAAVKQSFESSPFDLTQHGYARTQPFDFDSFNIDNNGNAELVLTLKGSPDIEPHLDLTATFNFDTHGFGITLLTQNNSDHPVTISQALHTYLPTDDITQTTVSGFDGIHYSDTLTEGWQTKTQQGNITFGSEVDRIYHGAPNITLNTPAQTYHLHADGSNSTVVWNPWIEKSKQVSQFANDDYERMLCIETANAHLDVVQLVPKQIHRLTLRLSKQSKV